MYLLFIDTGNFDNVFDGSDHSPGKVAIAFYAGIFSYSGWYVFYLFIDLLYIIQNIYMFLYISCCCFFRNYLNFMTEELKNPYVWVSITRIILFNRMKNEKIFHETYVLIWNCSMHLICLVKHISFECML